MVLCKFYQRGNCRYGQYCQFEHVNNFGNRRTDENKSLAQAVAEEVLLAERGGQWLLSCFGPLKEKPCIPGMEDLSPDEVRWEIYQAQKNGTVEQAKMQYQRLCQEMKAKRDALKNPTREMVLMLEKFERESQSGGFSSGGNLSVEKSSTFAFPKLQLGSSSSVFGNQGGNAFGGGGFGSSGNNSVFGSGNFAGNSVFGGASTSAFAAPSGSSSLFGNMTQSSGQPFASNTQQSGSTFGGTTSQPVFGQPSVFGTTNQTTNVFARPQVSQSSSSIFGGSNTVFGNSAPQQSASIFGGAKTSTANPFGGSSVGGLQSNTNTIFATNPSTNSSTIFGAAPTFGAAPSFVSQPVATAFNQQLSFAAPSGGIFGNTNASSAQNFALVSQSAGGSATFSTTSTAPTVVAAFPNPTSNAATTFGQPTSIAGNFGSVVSTVSNPFVAVTSSPFTTTNTSTAVAPFSNPGFTSNPQSAPTPFANQNKSPFAPTSTTATTTTTTVSNPFAPKTQQVNLFAQTQITSASDQQQPFGKSPFATSITVMLDESVYSIEGQLTDDEKSMYAAEKFILGKVPLKPPTKDVR